MFQARVRMPRMGSSVHESTVVEWKKSVGDRVLKGDALLSAESDKVEFEIESPAAGVITEILVDIEATVPVGEVLVILETEEEVPDEEEEAQAPTGHPSAGPEGIEMLRDGGTYVEMGQFTDAGSIDTNWHRICTKDINVLGSWAFTANDIPLAIDMLSRARDRYPWSAMQTTFPFSEAGVRAATQAAIAMRCVKATIVPDESVITSP